LPAPRRYMLRAAPDNQTGTEIVNRSPISIEFLLSLVIEPDVRIARILLSDKSSRRGNCTVRAYVLHDEYKMWVKGGRNCG
jgi:hypothetical protein